MSERDTHFLGFAKLLWDELPDPPYGNSLLTFDEWSAACEKIIAQRTYDLAYHFIEDAYELLGTFSREIHQSVEMLNDIRAWPDTAQERGEG